MAGTFVYAPAARSVLNVGSNQTLSVTFQPTDSVAYTPATASVRVSVVATPPPADTQAPTVPATLTATAVMSHATLSWSASSDSEGVVDWLQGVPRRHADRHGDVC